MDLAEYIARIVNEAPPLTSEQRDRLALLLGPSRREPVHSEPMVVSLDG